MMGTNGEALGRFDTLREGEMEELREGAELLDLLGVREEEKEIEGVVEGVEQ